MDLNTAIDVIESVAGFTDADTSVGEAWAVVMAQLNAAPAPAGEVGELVAWLTEQAVQAADCEQPMAAGMLTWAAQVVGEHTELLEQRKAAPVPVASDVYFEFVVSGPDDCTQAGGIAPTYAQALSEGQHYLAQYQQDGPHTLEVRRVEVLPPGAFPVPVPAPGPAGEVAELVAWLRAWARGTLEEGQPATIRSLTRAADLLERQAVPVPVAGWQPISTAPKDGTEILASDYDDIDIVSYEEWSRGVFGWTNREMEDMFPAWWQPLPDDPPLPSGEVEHG